MSALQYAYNLEQYPYINGKIPDFDLLQSIRSLLKTTIVYLPHHVKGHQDQYDRQLTFHEELNVLADKLANTRRLALHSPLLTYQLPNDKWSIILPNGRIGQHFEDTVYNFCSHTKMLHYWTNKCDWTENTFSTVNWNALLQAQKCLSLTKSNWISKHATGNCGVNTVLFKWKQRENSECPRCGEPETVAHVWKCKGANADIVWMKSIQSLTDWLANAKTDPDLQAAILAGLQAWLHPTLNEIPSNSLLNAQTKIGWDHLLLGLTPLSWDEQQRRYAALSNRPYRGYRWISALINKLWDIAWDLWEHRNGVAHAQLLKQKAEELDNCIQAELAQGPPNADDAKFFTDDYQERLLHATSASKTAWLAHITALRSYQARHHMTYPGIRGMQQTLRKFLKG